MMRIGELINAMRASRELGRKWYSSSGIAKELFVGYWNDMTLLGRRGRGGKEGKANRLFMQKKENSESNDDTCNGGSVGPDFTLT
jgi:hypothetical protein